MSFSASAFAVDVKVTGEYYAAGMYQDRTTFIKNGYYETLPYFQNPTFSDGTPSTAFFYQRLRVQTDFIVSPSLKLITRFNAMERIWGGARSESGTTLDSVSAATRAENENIGFDWAYVEYVSPIGMFDVGYMDDGSWGTVFGDTSTPQGIASWAAQMKGWTVFFQLVKISDNSKSAVNPSATLTDNDMDKYQGGFIYDWKGNQAGLLFMYYRDAITRVITEPYDNGSTGNVYIFEPYAILKFGPVKVQAEVDYAFGNIKMDNPSLSDYDMTVDDLAAFVDATVDLKQFYVGGTFAYVAGQDWSNYNTTGAMGKIKGGLLTGGMDWNPTLILFNNERHHWAGPIYGNNITSTYMNYISQQFGLNDTGMYNAWFFQGRAGFRPNDKWDIMASLSYAVADNKTLMGAPDAVSGTYGTEIDLVGNYKVTNNLTYMVGAAYLFAGDYFKGFDSTSEVRDDYMFINKLTMKF